MVGVVAAVVLAGIVVTVAAAVSVGAGLAGVGAVELAAGLELEAGPPGVSGFGFSSFALVLSLSAFSGELLAGAGSVALALGPGSIVARFGSLTRGAGVSAGTEASPRTSWTVRTTSSMPTCDLTR